MALGRVTMVTYSYRGSLLRGSLGYLCLQLITSRFYLCIEILSMDLLRLQNSKIEALCGTTTILCLMTKEALLGYISTFLSPPTFTNVLSIV